jgi:copper(I)-binding protein
MRRTLLRVALLACASFYVLPVSLGSAHEFRAGDIAIDRPWTRAVGASAPTAAGYMVLRNGGTVPDRLVSAATPMATAIEMHQMSMTDGIMRMRPLPDGIELPPGQSVRLEPGGLHLMLIGPTGGLARGTRVPVTLRFERAGQVAVELIVEAAGARAGAHQGH